MTILSVDDAFTTGVAFDLLGGFLLARGLLADPRDMAHRASTLVGYNGAIIDREVRARTDGEVGLAMLVFGFLLQFGGYTALIWGATVETDTTRALVALVLATALALVAYVALTPVRARRVRKLRPEVEAALRESGATD
jgi:hypothetical protein